MGKVPRWSAVWQDAGRLKKRRGEAPRGYLGKSVRGRFFEGGGRRYENKL